MSDIRNIAGAAIVRKTPLFEMTFLGTPATDHVFGLISTCRSGPKVLSYRF
jgi:hypothetical protein